MKKVLFIFLFTTILFTTNFAQNFPQQLIPDTVFNKYVIPCGLSPENILKLDVSNEEGIQLKTLPINFEALAIIQCGRFDIYYEDLLSTTPNGGFSDPTEGLNRRNTLCAVLTYVQSVFDFSNIPLSTPIKLHVNQSFAPTVNPAPNTTTFLAFAGPTFINTGTPSIINGFVSDYVNTGIDPATSNQYHASLTVNFDQTFNPNPTPINWLNNYTLPIQNCHYDLYSVLLHEIGHTLGWLSYTRNNSTTGFPESILGNNQFSALDNTLHKGTVLPLNLNPLIVGAPSSPSINPIYATNTNALTNNDIWINPLAAPDNDPVYLGLLVTFWPTSFAVNSILSHLDDQMWMYSIRARISPGDNKDYVMGPFGVQGILRRTFENIEINTFLNLGYAINPSFPGIVNVPNSLPYSSRMASYPNYLDNLFPETVTPDFTLVNNIGSSIVINLSTDPTIVDNDGDPVSVLPSSLVNIRGCGNGGNNHNQLVLSSANQIITYTPRPNFYGRAQFGFKLFDGKDEGSYVIYTIDVLRGTNVNCTPGSNLILNGNLEEGSEVKQLGVNEVIDASVVEQTLLREGKLRLGIHFGDSHPGNYLSNNWTPFGSGDMIRNSQIRCNGTQYKSSAGWWNTSFPTPTSNVPKPLPAGNNGDRYRDVSQSLNYFNLCSDMQTCKRYVLEFDYFAQPFWLSNGTVLPLTIGFTNTAILTALPTHTYSTVENITITNNSWQHITIPFTYCGTTPASIMNLQNTAIFGFLMDNFELREDLNPPPPLTASINPANPSICVGDNITLSSTVNDALCNVTYLWSPGGATTPTINVAPSSTTTYSLTVDDGCRSTTVNNTVTVNPLPTITITPSAPTICLGESTNLAASGALTYVWSPATGLSSTTDPTVIANPTTTTYTVTGTDINGCSSTSTVTVTVDATCGSIDCTLPTTLILPNGATGPTTLSNAVVEVQGLLTISSNATYTNVKFKMAAGARINITSGNTLTLNKCHLFSCTQLWKEITVNPNANLYVMTYTET